MKKILNSSLIRAFQKGEEWAFSEIYRRYQKPILKYVFDRTKNQEAAQDLSQEVFFKVHRFRASFHSKYAFSTWLWTITRNTLLDWHRKNKAEGHPALFDSEENPQAEIPCNQPGADTLLERKADRRVLKKYLKSLTRTQKRVLWLRVAHHLPYLEISKRLGLSLSSVKCLTYRSRLALTQKGLVPTLA